MMVIMFKQLIVTEHLNQFQIKVVNNECTHEVDGQAGALFIG